MTATTSTPAKAPARRGRKPSPCTPLARELDAYARELERRARHARAAAAALRGKAPVSHLRQGEKSASVEVSEHGRTGKSASRK